MGFDGWVDGGWVDSTMAVDGVGGWDTIAWGCFCFLFLIKYMEFFNLFYWVTC